MAQLYDHRRNIIWDETEDEANERLRKARIGMKIADEKAKAIEMDKKRRGYCKRCGLLLPLSGICECGCRERREIRQGVHAPSPAHADPNYNTINHKAGKVKGGWVHPGILAMYDK